MLQTPGNADIAREFVTEGIHYLADRDGYSRHELQELVNSLIEQEYEED